MAELSQKQLEEMVNGKPAKPAVQFFEKAALNVAESNLQGRRVYDTVVYMIARHSGVKDAVSHRASKSDFAKFPNEYQTFLNSRQGARQSPKIDIIPGLQLAHMQELIDMGLATIEALADAAEVPSHLTYAHQSAVMLNQVLELQYAQGRERETVDATQDIDTRPIHVPAENRQEHHRHVGQRTLSESDNGRREVTERTEETGRPHHSEVLKTIDNWKLDFGSLPMG